MLSDSHSDVSATAAWALDELGSESDRLVECLAKGLSSRDARIAAVSALHLGRLGAKAIGVLNELGRLVESADTLDHEGTAIRPRLAAKHARERILVAAKNASTIDHFEQRPNGE